MVGAVSITVLPLASMLRVVRRHRRQLDVRDLPAFKRQPPTYDTGTGRAGFTRTETMVRRRPQVPPESAISSGGRRAAASPSSASGFWSNEKMKYDFGLISPSRLSLSADVVEGDARPRAGLPCSTASGGHARVALDQRLDQRGARADASGFVFHAGTSSWTKRSSGTSPSSPTSRAISRNVNSPARSRGPKR